MKRFLTFALMLGLLCTASVFPASASSDAVSDEVITQVIGALGIMTGDENGDLNLSDNVTRAEFARMLVATSSYKDKVSAVSNVSPFRDVPYTHWAAAYVKTAVEQGWLTGYLDGTYHPEQNITLEEADTGVLKLLGYSTTDFSGAYPYGQLSLANSLGLNDRISASQGDTMTRQDMMYLFYNLLSADTKEGTAYSESLGYTLDADGNIDYLSVIADTLDGPFVVQSSLSALGISSDGATVYRNGYLSSADAIAKYDVVYYSKGLNSIWAYANAVTGVYQSASPSTASPTSVTVSGNTYSLGTSEAMLSLSTLGSLNIGDMITLLLGKDGEVVFALPADEYAQDIYGVVTSVSYETYQNAVGNTSTARTLTVIATDGQSYLIPCTNTSYAEDDLVQVTFSTDSAQVSSLKGKTLSGTYSSGMLGKKALADDIRILDVRENEAVRIYSSRLLGATLDSSDVRFYTENAQGEVSDLILRDFTGDLYEYGIITSVTENSEGMSLSGSYKYLVNGETQTVSTNNKTLGASYGPARLTLEDGQLSSVMTLSQIRNPTSISMLGITNEDGTWYFSDSCSVYLQQNGAYSLLSLTELQNNFSKYNLKAYYDKDTQDGGRIRIIVATIKS
ncbi:S-layer homology domain-containing protein [Intestinibacillus sp. Marseille-P6563]|mgnify:FL=1|uniref:S-layer homology domain-containing protein n=1 Tax=Intestinibacillus sp. Marseille-P6563 TaxID=2364792 RepID=UPI000F057A5A|nr:S-layer homology domain-containing protein [Intestinibacillus sp. Marseille-P6563]